MNWREEEYKQIEIPDIINTPRLEGRLVEVKGRIKTIKAKPAGWGSSTVDFFGFLEGETKLVLPFYGWEDCGFKYFDKWDEENWINGFTSHFNLEDKIFLKETLKLIPILESLNFDYYRKLPKYPIHRDLNPENILWKNGKLIGIIDFENVSSINDALIKDIAIIIQYACSNKNHILNINKTRYFLNEYKKHRKLTIQEIDLLPDILIAGFIEDFSYAYWMLVNDPKRAKLYRLRLYSKVAQYYYKAKINDALVQLKLSLEDLKHGRASKF